MGFLLIWVKGLRFYFCFMESMHGRCSILETIASAGDGDDLGVVEKAVEDGGGGG